MTDIGPSQRDAVKQISPPWLSTGNGEKYVYTVGLGLDALLEKANQASQAHMPTRCDLSALPHIGADRLIPQGPNEGNDAYRLRLQRAFDAWQHAGTARSVLEQVLTYTNNPSVVYSSQVPIGAIVRSSTSGTYATWDVFYSGNNLANPPYHVRVAPSNWNWDGANTWFQAFLVLYFPLVLSTTTGTTATLTSSGTTGFVQVGNLSGMTSANVGQFLVMSGAANSANSGTFQISQVLSSSQVLIANSAGVVPDANSGAITWTLGNFPSVGPGPAWGQPGVTWGDSTRSWGLNVSSSYITGLQSLVKLWKQANTFYPWVVISFAGGDGSTGKEFSPNSSNGSGNPDGTWGTWAKIINGTAVPSRSTGLALSQLDAFCDGTAIYQNSFVPTGT